VPAVTGTALLAGAAVLATARTAREREPTSRMRALGLAALLPLAAIAALGHAGNRAATAVDEALARDDPEAALAAAHRARRWAPWSTDAQRLEAEVYLAEGRNVRARAILRDAVASDPRSWELWYDLALASEGSARAAAAARARALNPYALELAALPRSRGTAQDR
jgi:predicted Zn-dependent protease